MTKRITHNRQQVFTLMGHIKETYAASNLSDDEFAKSAETALGFPITGSQVKHNRTALGIQPTYAKRQATIPFDYSELEKRVFALEEKNRELARELAILQRRTDTYIGGGR